MVQDNSTEVLGAFQRLLEVIEVEIDSINKTGARAQERRDYGGASTAIERAHQITALRDRVLALRKEWESLTASPQTNRGKQITREKRRNLGRLEAGLRTPETAYYQPILKALFDLGGSAKVKDVLEKVELLMKRVLTEVDYKPLKSKPQMLRWQETAQWARFQMVHEGLLKPNSPWGIWEITEAGYVAINKGDY